MERIDSNLSLSSTIPPKSKPRGQKSPVLGLAPNKDHMELLESGDKWQLWPSDSEHWLQKSGSEFLLDHSLPAMQSWAGNLAFHTSVSSPERIYAKYKYLAHESPINAKWQSWNKKSVSLFLYCKSIAAVPPQPTFQLVCVSWPYILIFSSQGNTNVTSFSLLCYISIFIK